MTYGDIYTKFLIEYDKANVTSSYPSLTVYEIATVLDKAYLTIIAQKLTGNNYRKSYFESDIKSIEDLRPLLGFKSVSKHSSTDSLPKNMLLYSIGDITRVAQILDGQNETKYNKNNADVNESDFLYYVSSNIQHTINEEGDVELDYVQLVTRDVANRFMLSSVNIPWIENPVCYIEDEYIKVLYDPYVSLDGVDSNDELYENLNITYIKRPLGFITLKDQTRFNKTKFELSDTMAEEIINLAISMSLEIVESPRLQTKEQTRQLES